MIEAQIWCRRAPKQTVLSFKFENVFVLSDLALLKKRQLLPEEQILSYKSAGEMDAKEYNRNRARRPVAVRTHCRRVAKKIGEADMNAPDGALRGPTILISGYGLRTTQVEHPKLRQRTPTRSLAQGSTEGDLNCTAEVE
jgi:hypothetical protein